MEDYECSSKEAVFEDRDDELAQYVRQWLENEVEARAPGRDIARDYERTLDQQRFAYLSSGYVHFTDQRHGEKSPHSIFTEAGERYLTEALESGHFRPGLAQLMMSFHEVMLPLGRHWLVLTPGARHRTLLVTTARGGYADGFRWLAVLQPLDKCAEGDVVQALATQYDIRVWLMNGTPSDANAVEYQTLNVTYGHTVWLFRMPRGLIEIPPQGYCYALKHSVVLASLLK